MRLLDRSDEAAVEHPIPIDPEPEILATPPPYSPSSNKRAAAFDFEFTPVKRERFDMSDTVGDAQAGPGPSSQASRGSAHSQDTMDSSDHGSPPAHISPDDRTCPPPSFSHFSDRPLRSNSTHGRPSQRDRQAARGRSCSNGGQSSCGQGSSFRPTLTPFTNVRFSTARPFLRQS